MKIGVVTYWYGNSNYGMIMQCWALQQYLKKMGHEPYVIRYQPERPWYIRLAKWCLKYLLCAVSRKHRVALKQVKYNAIKDKERGFDDFRKTHLDFSERIYKSIGELRKNPPKADCYISGSDQIWSNNLKSSDSKGYYLSFGDDKVKRIAYAPSFGTMKYDDSNMHMLTEALSLFNAISCREIQGVKYCNKAGYEAVKVEDPTLFLSKDDYSPLLVPTAYQDYIFIYSVNMGSPDDIYWNELLKLFNKDDFVITPSTGSIEGGELFGDDVNYVYANVGEWLSLINNSRMVVTSSFHGVVFSIIFNKQFCFVPLKGLYSKTNNRIIELLESLGLKDIIINTPNDYNRVLDLQVDWNSVNNKKEEMIKYSAYFLSKALL